MKGTIKMEFDGPKTKIAVRLNDVDFASKCQAVDNLLESLDVTGMERLFILAAVAEHTEEDKDNKEESSDESGCVRN